MSSLKFEGDNVQNNPTIKQSQAKSQGQAQAQTQTRRETPSFVQREIGTRSRLLGHGMGDETLEKIDAKFNVLFEGVKDTEIEFGTVKLLKNASGINYNGLVVYQKEAGSVIGHVLLIERSGQAPRDRVDRNHNTGMELIEQVMPSDALDVFYIEVAKTAVASKLGVSVDSINIVDGTLIPNEFDANDELSISKVIENTVNAIHAESSIIDNTYQGESIPEIIANNPGGRFDISIEHNYDGLMINDAVGMPIKQDICLILSYKNSADINRRSVNLGENVKEIARVYGYVDFALTDTSAMAARGQYLPTQRFLPMFVITDMTAGDKAPTPDIIGLALAQLVNINQQSQWASNFFPRPGKNKGINYNNIGALNLDAAVEHDGRLGSVGEMIKFDAKSDLNELVRFIQMTTIPQLAIAIDVPSAGPSTWYTSMFRAIATNTPEAPEAINRLNSFLVKLTGGNYQIVNRPFFSSHRNKIHGGFYRADNGEFRDLREMSTYLSVANWAAETNQGTDPVNKYHYSLNDPELHEVYRAQGRRELIDEMTKGQAVYKQFYDRLIFDGGFIADLTVALQASGFAPTTQAQRHGPNVFAQRPMNDLSSAMIDPSLRTTVQNNTYYGYKANHLNYGRHY